MSISQKVKMDNVAQPFHGLMFSMIIHATICPWTSQPYLTHILSESIQLKVAEFYFGLWLWSFPSCLCWQFWFQSQAGHGKGSSYWKMLLTLELLGNSELEDGTGSSTTTQWSIAGNQTYCAQPWELAGAAWLTVKTPYFSLLFIWGKHIVDWAVYSLCPLCTHPIQGFYLMPQY